MFLALLAAADFALLAGAGSRGEHRVEATAHAGSEGLGLTLGAAESEGPQAPQRSILPQQGDRFEQGRRHQRARDGGPDGLEGLPGGEPSLLLKASEDPFDFLGRPVLDGLEPRGRLPQQVGLVRPEHLGRLLVRGDLIDEQEP